MGRLIELNQAVGTGRGAGSREWDREGESSGTPCVCFKNDFL